MPSALWTHDRKLSQQHSWLIGVDEAGRGALAGSVVAAAVVVHRGFFQSRRVREACATINDSKQMKAVQRSILFERIVQMKAQGLLDYSVQSGSVAEIQTHNIVGATCLAMTRAVDDLISRAADRWQIPEGGAEAANGQMDLLAAPLPDELRAELLVDGPRMKRLRWQHQGIVKGDGISLVIAMASILAKVARDQVMETLGKEHPVYGFGIHKGYGVPAHLAAIGAHGSCEHHRCGFLRNL